MAAMNIPFFRIPVPEVLEREIDQNITACNTEVEHLNQLRAAYQSVSNSNSGGGWGLK
jgi:hypothetical protein